MFLTVKKLTYRGYKAEIKQSNGFFIWDIGEPGAADRAWITAAEAEENFKATIDQDESEIEGDARFHAFEALGRKLSGGDR